MSQPTRHILCMSGGKDSTALALYMRDRIPDMEYVFCDTDKELTETYEYLNQVEAFLGKKDNSTQREGWLRPLVGGFRWLPTLPQMRWPSRRRTT